MDLNNVQKWRILGIVAKPLAKRAYHHGDLRRALLDAALAVIETSSPRALTMRAIAQRAGVTQAAPYHHFADKEAILAAVAEEGFAALGRALNEGRAAAGEDAIDRMRALGTAYIRFGTTHPSHYKVMFGERGTDVWPESLKVTSQAAFAPVVEELGALQMQGRVPQGNVLRLAVIVWSMVHGVVMLWIDGCISGPAGDVGSIAEIGDDLVDLLSRGLTAGLSSPLPAGRNKRAPRRA
jgi:AcrR family transcriptional regulator